MSHQILACLSFLSKHNIIHCDLKPENILLREENSRSIKIIDFGSSCFENNKVFSYIQSRFYRAPEIVLGIPYSPAIDMWSLGCILAELYTGLPIFPAESEKELISCIAEVIGEPPIELIQEGLRTSIYFTDDGKMKPFKNNRGRKRCPATRPLKSILKGADEAFYRLIEDCLQWDPKARIHPDIALQSSWFSDTVKNTKIYTRYCKISMEDIIKHTPQLRKFYTHKPRK